MTKAGPNTTELPRSEYQKLTTALANIPRKDWGAAWLQAYEVWGNVTPTRLFIESTRLPFERPYKECQLNCPLKVAKNEYGQTIYVK